MTYDLVIVGSSAAGVSAGIYAARRNLNLKVITVDTGGEVAQSGEIANYPGFVKTDGVELSQKFTEHLKSYNIIPETGVWVEKIEKKGNVFTIIAKKGDGIAEYQAKTIILTTGVHPRHLNVPGEEEFRGKGVTYCTVCDGPLFRGKTTVTIGGGNSALESAIMMAALAKKVYVLNINPEMKGEQVLIDNLKKQSNVEIIGSAKTTKIVGENVVKSVEYESKIDGVKHVIDVQGAMIHIGMIPNSSMVPPEVEKNKVGEIKVNTRCETTLPGFFAAGDVTDVPYKQIAISTGQGVTAALAAVDYLNRMKA
ncbi:MAG TPA: FAD-dependent oxidoreductase [Patescibacteria group bacterium]|nr:FAD-dependent oxidoreductase [Patescibacteria group bacterium]